MLRSLVLLSFIILGTVGCNSTHIHSHAEPHDAQQIESIEPLHAEFQYRADSRDNNEPLSIPKQPINVHKRVTDYADQLAMSLIDNAYTLKKTDKLAVASFVRFNRSLTEPTVVGNRLAEALIAELQTFGVTVIDTKLSQNLSITERGDLAFSRDIKHLADNLNIDYIVTGTMIERPRGIEVNERIIGVKQQNVAAASDLFIPDFIVANETYYSAGY